MDRGVADVHPGQSRQVGRLVVQVAVRREERDLLEGDQVEIQTRR